MVCHHAVTYGQYKAINIPWFNSVCYVFRQGHLGVNLFFVISGFCIHLAWTRQFSVSGRAASVNFIRFWKRRFYRLYPAYFAALCISMLIIVIAIALGRNIPLVNLYPHPKSLWVGLDFISHLFMFHGVIPLFDNAAGNPPLWSLAREEYLYLMYFLFLGWRYIKGIFSSVFMSLISGIVFYLVMSVFVPKSSPWWHIIVTSSVVLWIQWCLGALAVEAYYDLIKLPSFCYQLYMFPVWAVISKISEVYLPVLSPLLWGMTFFTLLNFCARLEKEKRWVVNPVRNSTPSPITNGFPIHGICNGARCMISNGVNKITVWLSGVGLFSYSLYLMHYPVRGIVKQALGNFALTNNPWIYILNALAMAVAGYYAGRLLFVWVESRFLINYPAASREVSTFLKNRTQQATENQPLVPPKAGLKKA